MRIRAAGLIAGMVSAPLIAVADDSVTLADLSRGDEVRVKLTSGGKTVRGTIDATGPDEIVVRPEDPARSTLRLSTQQMAQLEVVRGQRSRWVEGALIGFLPGALFLGYTGAVLGECDPDCNQTSEVLVYALVGGSITAAVGALIGLAVKTDRWVPVRSPRPKLALSLAPTKGGFRAELAVGF